MKTYSIKVYETFVGTNKVFYEIDAESKEDAQRMVEEGSVDFMDSILIGADDYNLDMDTFEITEVNDGK